MTREQRPDDQYVSSQPDPAKQQSPDQEQKGVGFFLSILRAPAFADPAQKRIANLQNIILLGLFITIFLYLIISSINQAWTSVGIAVGAGLFVLMAFILLRRGFTNAVSWILVFIIYVVSVFGLLSFAINIVNVITLSVTIILAGLLLPPSGVVLTSAVSIFTLFVYPYFNPPAPESFLFTLLGLGIEGFLLAIASSTLKNSFGEIDASTQNLLITNRSLEELNVRVEERAHDLELAALVAQTITEHVADLNQMLSQTVETIRSRFKLYHTQIYLMNPSRKALVLNASTGEAGRQLLQRGHRLPVNPASLNGRAALEKQAILIADTAQSANFLPNPLLLATRSELAIPLITGDQVVGVLDMQSEQPNAFNEFNLPTFKTLAGQLAIALQNASLFTETQEARHLAEENAKRFTEKGWQDYLDGIERPERIGFVYDQKQSLPLDEAISPLPSGSLNMPIVITGATVGSIQAPLDGEPLSEQDYKTLELIAANLARHIENLRLLEQTEQYRHQAEQAIRRLTREGWDAYQQMAGEASKGYLYTNNRVKLLATKAGDVVPNIRHPLAVRGETIGTLELALSAGETTLDPEMADLVTKVSEALTNHIETLRLTRATETALAEVEHRATELEILNEIVVSTSASLDMQDILPIVARNITRLLSAHHCEISQLDRKQHRIQMLADFDIEIDGPLIAGTIIPIAEDDFVIATIETTKRSVVIPDAKNNPLTQPVRQLMEARNTECLLVAPLLVRGELTGMIGVGASEPGREFTTDEVKLVETIAGQLAGNLENVRLFREAQQLAKREALINTINQKIQGATSVESALETTAREIGHLLKARRTVVEISSTPRNGQ